MELEDEETNLEFERINWNSFNPRVFFFVNKKSQLHINPNPNRQYHSDVWNQLENRFQEPLHDN
jgi:hypothetical protein